MHTEHTEETFRSGFVAIIGLPNVGKSTLLNVMVGERLSIVTHKAQTTRQRFLGILSDAAHQAVFVDTPGLLEPRYLLQESMLAEANRAVGDADVLVYVVDGGFGASIEHGLAYKPRGEIPTVLCLNKADRTSDDGAALVSRFRELDAWGAVIPTVAVKGAGIDELKAEILSQLPFSPAYYPTDEVATASVRFLAAELIRETCLQHLSEEVPYAVAVGIEEFRDSTAKRSTYISASLYVERNSQKGIVIGKGGQTLKEIGKRSRHKIEELIGEPVYLELRVKVLANWRKRRGKLKLLGYPTTVTERT
ncbi:MAG: GTPase Era [Gemmatimonadota bacterium]